jgi:hypothetical protein
MTDMTKTHRKAADERLRDAAEDSFTSEGGFVPAAQTEREREMVDYEVSYDGVRYCYNGYRYDRLDDAVRYARLMRSRPLHHDAGGSFTPGPMLAPPTDAQRELMASMAIRFEAGTYRFESFRYDRLADAVNYATVSARRSSDEVGRS